MANLKVRDVAERLDVSSKTVYKWLREGLIPASRLGRSWIVSEEALQAALAPGSNRPLASAVVNEGASVSGSAGVLGSRVRGNDVASGAANDVARGVANDVASGAANDVARGAANDVARGAANDVEPIASVKPLERRTPVGRINVAIVGLGNCASSLIQGVHKYGEVDENSAAVPGVMHNVLGGYTIGDVNIVAAFDVDKEKVGVDINEAIFAKTNNALQFHDVPRSGITVDRGMTHDGIGEYLEDVVERAPGSTADIVGILRDREVDVVINYLPVGSEQATKWYVEQVLAAGCAFVNCIPVFIANQPYWQKRFEDKGVPVVGDDIKSQVGATIIHRVLARLFEDRGVRLDRTYQLNFGGNTDFYNMLERARLVTKKISKTQSVQSQLEKELPTDDVHIGPSDHVPWLEDRKWAYIRLEGTSWGDVPLNVELKLEVEDSPNSAGVAIDAIRSAKIALDKGVSGAIEPASAYFMKSPPVQMRDDDARRAVVEFAENGVV